MDKNIVLVVPVLIASHASGAVYFTEVTNPNDHGGIYTPTGGEIDYLRIQYNDVTDVFSFRVDFTADPGEQIGDAYFRFTNDGLVPDGNLGGDPVNPIYIVDQEAGKLSLYSTSTGVLHTLDADTGFNLATGKGHIAFEHNVSDIWSIFGTPLNENWSGGSFSTDIGLWAHIIDSDYYEYNSGPHVFYNGDFSGNLGDNWIVFDPDTLPVVPAPASALALSASGGILLMRRRRSEAGRASK